MSYPDYMVKSPPAGLRKALYFNWGLAVLLAAVAGIGFMMLYSVAGGSVSPWAEPQMLRFAVCMAAMIAIGFTPVWFWRNMSGLAYLATIAMLLAVELVGVQGKGAQRWLDLGVTRVQPSELMKVSLMMALAAYYDWLPLGRVSHPVWLAVPVAMVLLPVGLVLRQPDLGTSILLMASGGALMFIAGVHWGYFAAVAVAAGGLVAMVFATRGTDLQMLADYQYARIDAFLDPSLDPLGAGYHITQSKIALGSGGWGGRGFMQGTQSRLNFLPEKHTDFIFTTLAEEFGFVGAAILLAAYIGIVVICVVQALSNRDRYSSLLTLGVAATFFLFFAVNMAMVMGLVPVVGVPLPLVSYGGSSMLVVMVGFGLVQSAQVHKPR